MRAICLSIALFLSSLCLAQVREDFSDGDLTDAPEWYGNTESFKVVDSRLQLNDLNAGTAFMVTPSLVSSEASWQFDVSMTFNPSSRNYCAIYLISDAQLLTGHLNGYYLKIGGSTDEISLFRQDQTKHTEILDGPDGITDTDQVNLTIRVTRDATDHWELLVKTAEEPTFTSLGSVQDGFYHKSGFFGFLCEYTITRSQGFYFDNINVAGTIYDDESPPQLLWLKTIAENQIELHFDEPINVPTKSMFLVNGNLEPSELRLLPEGTWELTFPFQFEHGVEYVLEISNIADLQGNVVSLMELFKYWETASARLYDLIINEIMADPTPPLQLPELEYIELLNRSEYAINLKNWTLSDRTKTVKLPDFLLAPASYLLLPAPGSSAYPGSTTILEMSDWPNLNNSNDELTLKDSLGNIIHFVNYTDDWYRSSIKKHGGWSLELIDPTYPCSSAANWAASTSFTGGTPGFVNSVLTDNPDLAPPVIIGSYATDVDKLSLYFDQPLGNLAGVNPVIKLNPKLTVDTFFVKDPIEPILEVHLGDNLQENTIYTLTAIGFIDCNGNIDFDAPVTTKIGLEQPSDSGDVVINELMFDPGPLGERFIEIYNRSDKALNLKNWGLAVYKSGALDDFQVLTQTNLMIYPGQLVAFTENIERLLAMHPDANESKLFEMNNLPFKDRKTGIIALVDANSQVIDQFEYNVNLHHRLLVNSTGVSLERTNPQQPSNDSHNWRSGSEEVGYATPGLTNSQSLADSSESVLEVLPDVFAAVSTRFPAYTQITFSPGTPGAVGSVYIFNLRGIRVRTLVNNALLSKRNIYQWDGSNDHGQAVPMGYYIVLAQISSGPARGRWKKTVVVAPEY